MTDDSAPKLRDAASAAHRRGDIEAAVALFEKILELFPETPEGVDAVFYLSSIGKGRRRPANRVPVEKEEVPTKRLEDREAPGNFATLPRCSEKT